MTIYTVRWEINIVAGSAEDTARQALTIQRDPESVATEFAVSAASLSGRSGWRHIDVADLSSEESTCAEIKAAMAADSP